MAEAEQTPPDPTPMTVNLTLYSHASHEVETRKYTVWSVGLDDYWIRLITKLPRYNNGAIEAVNIPRESVIEYTYSGMSDDTPTPPSGGPEKGFDAFFGTT